MTFRRRYPQAFSLAMSFTGFTVTKNELNNKLWEQVVLRIRETRNHMTNV